MLTTTGGIIIRTRVADINMIGRNTQGVRLIRVEEGDTVSSLAKLPEDRAGHQRLRPTSPATSSAPTPIAADGHPPHILDDGVGQAEASDHIDDLDADGEPDAG